MQEEEKHEEEEEKKGEGGQFGEQKDKEVVKRRSGEGGE